MDRLTFWEKVFLSVLAFGVILAIGISWFVPGGGTVYLKDFILFTAGGGISYVFAQASSRASIASRVRSICARSAQRLGLLASHANDAAGALRAHAAAQPDPTLELVAASLDQIVEDAAVSIGDLEEAAGSKLTLDELVARNLREALSVAEELLQDEEPEIKERALSVLSKSLSAVAEDAAAEPREGERAPIAFECTQCHSRLVALLGLGQGESAHVTCSTCLARYAVHRTSGGQFQARIVSPKTGIHPASGPQIDHFVLECPECRDKIPVNSRETDPPEIIRNCRECGLRLYISRNNRSVERTERRPPVATTYTRIEGKVVFTCPNCSRTVRLAIAPHHPDPLKVTCGYCTTYIHTSKSL